MEMRKNLLKKLFYRFKIRPIPTFSVTQNEPSLDLPTAPNIFATIFEEQNQRLQSQSDFDVLKTLENCKNLPFPQNFYVIAITPRSGSSWLTSLMVNLSIFGTPYEWFNEGSLPDVLRDKYPVQNIEQYCECVFKGEASPQGYFGTKISFFQYKLVRELLKSNPFPKTTQYIYLYRRDFVSQAISLYRAIETGFFHTTSPDFETLKNSDFLYSEEKIWEWIVHILEQEFGWMQIFSGYNIEPLYLAYEDLAINPHLQLLRIVSYLGQPDIVLSPQVFDSEYGQIRNSLNQTYLLQFTQKFHQTLEYCYQHRGKVSGQWIRKNVLETILS